MNHALSLMVIHDMKNSLAMLESTLERLSQTEASEEIARAYRQSQELKERLVSFLTLYKNDSSELQPVIREVEIAEFLEDIIDRSISARVREDVSIVLSEERIRVADDTPCPGLAFFDDRLAELAIESSIHNAMKYAAGRVEVWFEQDAEGVSMFILDDGPGIGLSDDIARRDSDPGSSSTGLGLALCQSVAQAHRHNDRHGKVQLSNAEGGGALFMMKLP